MAESLLPEASAKSQFLSLPVDAINNVCLHLSPNDVIKLSRTCSGLYTLVRNMQAVWRIFCKRVWLYSGPCGAGVSWYSEFCQWSDEWSQYSDCYADIKRAWDLICLKLRQSGKNPDLLFRPGAGEELLSATEKRLGAKLPISYRCFLRMHDGQVSAISSSFFCTELCFYSIQDSNSYMLQAAQLKERMGLVSLTKEGSELQSYSICVKHQDATQLGQIKCNSKEIYDNNHLPVSVRQHTLAPDFRVWFCGLAHELQSYPLVETALMRFPYSPQCVAITRGVKIQVGTAFSNAYSFYIEDKMLVIYHITISMSASESKSLTSQLLTRHWFISDDRGEKQSVEGPGVVGHTPVISPGTVFTYTSGSYVEREWSQMEGYFTFENKLTGEVFNAKVPSFKLSVPPYSWIDIIHK